VADSEILEVGGRQIAMYRKIIAHNEICAFYTEKDGLLKK